MEIVIKIPDEVLESKQYCRYFGVGSTKLSETIENGIPLPKGHGRLIDANDVDNHIVGSVDLRDCPTIIEADKENKKTDNLPSCNNCVHNGEWSSTGNCIKCSCFDRYEKRGKG